METRANYALVGMFTLGILAAAFAFVYWFSGLGGAVKRDSIRIVFTGTVTGLNRGSSVLFNGLRVGEVTDVRLLPDDPQRIYATAQIDRSTPLRSDTRARLESQALTGVVAIQLIGGASDAPILQAMPGQPLPTIIAEKSEFQDLLETARTISKRVDDVLGKIENLVTVNQEPLTNTVRNIEKFSQALGDNSGNVDKLLLSVGQAADKIGPLAERMETLSVQIGDILKVVDRDKVASIVDNTQKFTAALGGSSPDVATTLKNVSSISEKLNRAADQVEGVLRAAQNFLGSEAANGSGGAFSEINEAARSVRKLADNLDKRTADITTGINRFTGPGLRELENLTTEGRKTLTDINRTLRNVEKNPQQFIFGSRPSIPEYNGRR